MRHRKGLSLKDRLARSRLHRLLEWADGLVHGSVIRFARRCGNPRCRCARQDQKHVSWCLGVTIRGQTRMKHIPKAQERAVRRWVRQYQQARQLLEQISEAAWQHLRAGKE